MHRLIPRAIRSRAVPNSPRRRQGFTLVEMMIVVVIIGILAMLVVPGLVAADRPARENTLREHLRLMRTQVELFIGQHNGLPPGYPGGNRLAAPTEAALLDQLRLYSSATGDTAATRSQITPLGPYLQAIPANPFNQLDSVRVLGDAESMPAADGLTYGWFYQPATRQFIANTPETDASGVKYSDY